MSDTQAPTALGLSDAVSRGLADVQVSGAGDNVTSRINVTLTARTSERVTVMIPPGCQFQPNAAGFQTMVSTGESTVQVPAGPGASVTVTIPTICGSPFGYSTPPAGGGIGYTVLPQQSPVVQILNTVDGLGDAFGPLAHSIGMPPAMFTDTIKQYATWWTFGNPGLTMPIPQTSDGSGCPFCNQPNYVPGSLCVSCGYFPIAKPPDVIIPDPPPPPFIPTTIANLLTPQLSGRGATPEQIHQISSTFWEGVDTTVKAINRTSPGTFPNVFVAGTHATTNNAGDQVANEIEEMDPALIDRLTTLALVRIRRERGEESEDGTPPSIVRVALTPQVDVYAPDYVDGLSMYEKWSRACQMMVDNGRLGAEFKEALVQLKDPANLAMMVGVMAALMALGAFSAGLGYIVGAGLLVLCFGKQLFPFCDAVSAIVTAENESQLEAASNQLAKAVGSAGPDWILMICGGALGKLWGKLRGKAPMPDVEAPGGGKQYSSSSQVNVAEPDAAAGRAGTPKPTRPTPVADLGPGYAEARAQAAQLAEGVNPGGGELNCTNCARAVDARASGDLNIHARTNPAEFGAKDPPYFCTKEGFEQDYHGWFKDINAPTVAQQVDNLSNIVKVNGPGARGIVWGSRPNDLGHAFNVVNIDNHVFFLDGQHGAILSKADILAEAYSQLSWIQTNR